MNRRKLGFHSADAHEAVSIRNDIMPKSDFIEFTDVWATVSSEIALPAENLPRKSPRRGEEV